MAIRIALIGAGLFARDAHIPAIKAIPAFEVVAVCSRTVESAQQRADQFDYPVEVMTDVDALLARDDIDAVDIVLPIHVMPDVVRKALASGKHVISEKPIAPDVASGRALIAEYTGESVWMVAENYRYQDTYVEAAERIEMIGRPLVASWTLQIPFNAKNKYYHTGWRRDDSLPGGLFLDASVHHVAALRLMLGEIDRVSAFVSHTRSDLPVADSLAASLQFRSGVVATLSVTFGAAEYWISDIAIGGDSGWMTASLDKLTLHSQGETRTFSYGGVGNVQAELMAFADAIQAGEPHRNTPEQALQDVAVIEALLRSAREARIVEPEKGIIKND